MRIVSISVVLLTLLCAGCPVAELPPPVAAVSSSDLGPDEGLADLVDEALLANYDQRTLSADIHGAWQVLHGVLAYQQDFEIQTDQGPKPAVDFLLSGGRVKGFEPMAGDQLGQPARTGLRMELQLDSKIGQGHSDQWLAVLVQSGVTPETIVRTADRQYNMRDWINQVRYDVPRNVQSEFSWTLIALTAFDATTDRWKARDGQYYNVESLLKSELMQPLESSVCGGTHRLIGMAMALKKRRAEGNPIVGPWAEADELLQMAIEAAEKVQNPDGSYSTRYLERPGIPKDLGDALGTTGHVVEFLAITASDETLRKPWVQRSVRRLCQILQECREIDLECGALYHALHGLREYRNRMP